MSTTTTHPVVHSLRPEGEDKESGEIGERAMVSGNEEYELVRPHYDDTDDTNEPSGLIWDGTDPQDKESGECVHPGDDNGYDGDSFGLWWKRCSGLTVAASEMLRPSSRTW